jgi:hypothetical protein
LERPQPSLRPPRWRRPTTTARVKEIAAQTSFPSVSAGIETQGILRVWAARVMMAAKDANPRNSAALNNSGGQHG